MRFDGKQAKLVLGVAIAALITGVALAQTPTVRAALVRDVDNPDRAPGYADFISFTLAAGDGEERVCAADPVPDGKLLVLDQVSIGVNAPTGEIPKATVGYDAIGTVMAYLPLTDAGPSGATLNYWAGVWQLRGLRFAGTDRACIVVWRYPVSAHSAFVTATVTGHLVDRP